MLRLTLGAHQAALPLLNLPEGENKMEKLVDQDKDGKIAYQLPSEAKQTQLGVAKFNSLPTTNRVGGEKQGQP